MSAARRYLPAASLDILLPAYDPIMKLLGFRTGLMTNPFFKRLFLSDKAAYKAWMLAELERDPPVLFVPSHGAPLRGADLAGAA